MAAVPLAADLSRASGYEATIKLFPVQQVGFARRADLPYARHLLGTPSAAMVLSQKAAESAVPATPRAVQLLPTLGWTRHSHRHWRTVSARVVAPTPGQAAESAINVMLAIEYASEVDLVAHARKRLRHVRDDPALRVALRHFIKHPAARYAIRRPPTVVHAGSGALDRLIARLPGQTQARPIPWAAALAGVLLTTTMWLAATARLPGGLTRSRSARSH